MRVLAPNYCCEFRVMMIAVVLAYAFASSCSCVLLVLVIICMRSAGVLSYGSPVPGHTGLLSWIVWDVTCGVFRRWVPRAPPVPLPPPSLPYSGCRRRGGALGSEVWVWLPWRSAQHTRPVEIKFWLWFSWRMNGVIEIELGMDLRPAAARRPLSTKPRMAGDSWCSRRPRISIPL